jgi:hypothetical protein
VAGYDDIVTVATADGPVAQYRIQHNYEEGAPRNWVALTSFVANRVERDSDSLSAIIEGTSATREMPRLLKFPSGELPDALGDLLYFGGRYDGGSYQPAVLDEMWSMPNVDDEIYYVGDGKILDGSSDAERADVNASDTDIRIHMWPTSGNTDGLPISGLPEDGGIVRIDDELIAYRELDTSEGLLRGCERGVLGTEAKIHSFDARCTEMPNIPVAILEGGLTPTSLDIPLNKTTNIPRSTGYVKIGDEILGFTRVEGNRLVMPQDLRPSEDSLSGSSDTGPGLFHMRFGTAAQDHEDGAIVYYMPVRYPDRYVERSADPQASCIILRKRVDGAIWKRVGWDERIGSNLDVHVLVRFDGTPDWDSANIYNVSEGRVVSGRAEDFAKNPKSFLFELETAHDLNTMNIQADVIEVRISFQFQAGAYDTNLTPPADGWKDTPWLKAVRVEYVSPVTIHHSEEIR